MCAISMYTKLKNFMKDIQKKKIGKPTSLRVLFCKEIKLIYQFSCNNPA